MRACSPASLSQQSLATSLAAQPTQRQADVLPSRGRVLAAIKDEALATLLEYNLVAAGFGVGMAKSGKDMLAELGDYRPDVLLLDGALIAPSALQMCRSLRLRPDTRHVGIFMLTAEPSETSGGGELAFADDHLCKPFSLSELITRLGALIQFAATAHGQRGRAWPHRPHAPPTGR